MGFFGSWKGHRGVWVTSSDGIITVYIKRGIVSQARFAMFIFGSITSQRSKGKESHTKSCDEIAEA
jgi:hypothetical protein